MRPGESLWRGQVVVVATLTLLTVGAWALTLAQMPAMDAMAPAAAPAEPMGGSAMTGMGPMAMEGDGGLDPGLRLVVFLGMWVSMMAAMMLPAAAPMILTFGAISRGQRQAGGAFVPTWVFVAGYLAVWTSFGVYAWGMGELGEGMRRAAPAVSELGPRLGALAMLAAGLYQLTPLKQRCLAHCRSPLQFVLHGWRAGILGALRMGIEHGLWCLGCCWVLFVLLVVVGLASLPWMGVMTLIICAEKLLPRGEAVSRGVAAALLLLGVAVLLEPGLLRSPVG